MAGATKLLTAGGGGAILTPASSIASDVTVSVPSQNCTLGIAGPAFSAYAGTATTVPSVTNTKILYDTEVFDTNSNYDASTSRFTPTVAGYYLITATWAPSGQNGVGAFILLDIAKNGVQFQRLSIQFINAYVGTMPTGSTILYLNGSTDYIEFYGYQSMGATYTTATGQFNTWVQGCLLRAA